MKNLLLFFTSILLVISICTVGCKKDESASTEPQDPSTNGGTTWKIDTIVPAGTNAFLPALAVDKNGNPYISYLDDNDGYVKYAFKNGTNWSISPVARVANSNGTVANGGLSAIALDAANNPHVTYYDYGNGQLKYAKKIGSSWTTIVIPLPNDPKMSYASPFIPWADCSIVLDTTTGVAHISLQMSGGLSGFVLGYWRPGYAHALIVDSKDGNSGYQNAIALDASGFPGISYEARGPGGITGGHDGFLKYAHWNGSAFTVDSIASIPAIYWQDHLTSLNFYNNFPHIVYFGQGGYKHSYKSGASWTSEAIPYTSGYPSLSSSCDGTGKLHLALVGGSMKYFYSNGSSWSSEAMENNVGRCAIVVDRLGKIHIAYSTDMGVLKYASK